VETRDLRSLLEVVRTGSFTAAASHLGYTQSAISQQIASLEAQVGRPLLHRRPVRPTPAGQRLAEHAARILLRLDVAQQELEHLGRTALQLRVAACPLAGPHLLAAALRDLRAVNPALQVTVTALSSPRAIEALAGGEVDLAMVDGVTAPGNPLELVEAGLMRAAPLAEISLVVALASGHALGGRATLDLETLVDAPWITAPALAGGAVGPDLLSGYRPSSSGSLRYEGTDVMTLLALVAAGHGLALLPMGACGSAPGIHAIAVGSPDLVHRTEILGLSTVSGVALQLLEALRVRSEL
jgi:DNA-binding transcriptional LysR family regulator